jgi:hypothetical protein
MNKLEKERLNHWNRRLWRRHGKDWNQALSHIENHSLKIKVASILFWDMSNDKFTIDRDLTELIELSSRWKLYMEDDYEMNELVDELRGLGYPAKFALRRATPPKVDYRWRKK